MNVGREIDTPYYDNDLDETIVSVSSDVAGHVTGWVLHNASAATMFYHFYNSLVADATIGSPDFTIPVPAGETLSDIGKMFIPFNVGICVAATTAFNGTGNPGNNEAFATIFWR